MSDLRETDVLNADGTVTRDGKRYGCHCEISLGSDPDGCVTGDGEQYFCTLAILPSGRDRRSRWTCQEWRQVRGGGK